MQYKYIGKTCPFCQFAIKSNSSAVLCPACKVPHHQACWEENRGCTTFGCKETTFEAPAQGRVDLSSGTSANRQAVPASNNLNAFLAVALVFSIFAIIVLTVRLNANQPVKVASPAPQTTHQTTQQITTQITTAAPTTTTAKPATTTARPTTTATTTTTRAKTAPPTKKQTTNGTWWDLDF